MGYDRRYPPLVQSWKERAPRPTRSRAHFSRRAHGLERLCARSVVAPPPPKTWSARRFQRWLARLGCHAALRGSSAPLDTAARPLASFGGIAVVKEPKHKRRQFGTKEDIGMYFRPGGLPRPPAASLHRERPQVNIFAAPYARRRRRF